MGIYLNPDNIAFQRALNSEIYVDKTELIKFTNDKLFSEQQFICVSRPRRFGKSMAVNMLTAYYSKGCDSKEMFSKLKIANADSFEKHLNQYNVIHVNMVERLSNSSIDKMIDELSKEILYDLRNEYPDVNYYDSTQLIRSLKDVFAAVKIPFVFIFDEWDCIFRKKQTDIEAQTKYLDFLRRLLKDQSYVALAYMTGILPIKKYGEHSALNMFDEISMTDAVPFSEFTGFTDKEVEALCNEYDVDIAEVRRWYNGYNVDGISIYNPRSVVLSITKKKFSNYWTSTETYDALKVHIQRNFDGLKEKISSMIAGEPIQINTTKFQNDMTSMNSADDVLTLLIHLGYLTYDFNAKSAWIPNNEVQQEFINSVGDGGWENLMKAINASDKLLEATLNGDTDTVAEMIAESHSENTSILKYNDENSLACVISLAYYTARNKYIMHRELPTGKGFADIVYIPLKDVDLPAIVVELKHNKTSETAITQIKNKNYTDKISQYTGEILLVGISYDEEKGHTCSIEKIIK